MTRATLLKSIRSSSQFTKVQKEQLLYLVTRGPTFGVKGKVANISKLNTANPKIKNTHSLYLELFIGVK